MLKVLSQILSILILFVIIVSCSNTQPVARQEIVNGDNLYDSEFPSKSVSNQLEYISKTVKKLDCLAFYMSYVFAENNTLDEGPITREVLRKQSISNTVINESVTGTATVVYNDGGMIGLVTSAHVIDFPDTIISRYDNGSGPIQVLSIKVRQQNYIKDFSEGEGVEVIAVNRKHDIAFLKKVLGDNNVGDYQQKPMVLNYPIGNTKDLEWGSVVYVMGFPQGQQMVTLAIVSNPGYRSYRFLTDATYNRGISGSPVFAIRDGVPNLEWVGVATSSPAQQIYFTGPGKDSPDFINPDEPYTGEIYVDQVKTINYGITYNTTIESVINLIKSNERELKRQGFNMDKFFK